MYIKHLLFLGLLLYCRHGNTQRLSVLGQFNPYDSIQLNQNTPILPRLNTHQNFCSQRIIPILDLGFRYNPSNSVRANTGVLADLQREKWFARIGGTLGGNTLQPSGFVSNGILLGETARFAWNFRPIVRLGFTPSHYVSAQIGCDQNFYGEGFRSLFLSDVGAPYPFTSLRFNLGPVTYQTMGMYLGAPGNQKKYGINHYLNLNLGKHLRVSLFEAVIFNSNDTLSNRSFEPAYLNPFMVIRPTEYSVGSGDNVLMGGEFSIYTPKSTWYGQFIIDDLLMSALLQRKQYWGNKIGAQLGWKFLSRKGTHKMQVRSELNIVRPYTYSHIGNQLSYTYNNHVLAHPKGANFWELFSRLDYMNRQWTGMIELAIGQKGINAPFGGDVFAPYTLRPFDYGVSLLQGVKTNQLHIRVQCGRLLRRWNNMHVFMEFLGVFYANNSSAAFNGSPIIGLRAPIWNDYRF
ncbi:MAG: hypothetical protein ACKO4Y_08470 [Flavobacteriales bacterium]